MSRFCKKASLGIMLATTLVSVAVPAEAQRGDGWHQNDQGGRNWGKRGHHDDKVAGAIVGGVLALGIGAAIASSVNNDNRRRDYEAHLQDQDYYRSQAPYGTPQPSYDSYYPQR